MLRFVLRATKVQYKMIQQAEEEEEEEDKSKTKEEKREEGRKEERGQGYSTFGFAIIPCKVCCPRRETDKNSRYPI